MGGSCGQQGYDRPMKLRNAHRFWILWLAGIGCVAPPTLATDVYRWTDANGQVHYGQRAPTQTDADRIEVPGGARDDAADPDAAERRARQQRLLDAYGYEREKKKQKAGQDAAHKRSQAERCSRIQARWRAYSHPGPIYYRRADGGRDYISDEQRAARLEKMRPAYIEACGEAP